MDISKYVKITSIPPKNESKKSNLENPLQQHSNTIKLSNSQLIGLLLIFLGVGLIAFAVFTW